MTGPEHYREAERLMNKVTGKSGDPDRNGTSTEYASRILELARMHARLAQVAATIHAARVSVSLDRAQETEPWALVLDAGNEK